MLGLWWVHYYAGLLVHYLAFLSLCLCLRFSLAAMCWLTVADSGELILCIPSRAESSGSCSRSFKSATVGIFTPWKSANATHQGLGFLLMLLLLSVSAPHPENHSMSTPHCLSLHISLVAQGLCLSVFLSVSASPYPSFRWCTRSRSVWFFPTRGLEHGRPLSPCLSPSVYSHQKARSTQDHSPLKIWA